IETARELEENCRSGLVLREGIKAAIIGKPNVGKSSLLNALLQKQRAIVTPIPGTTRDSIEETVIYQGIPIHFIDTAGIRATEDQVESIGVERSKNSIEEADIIIWVLDSSEEFTEEDRVLWDLIKEKNHVIALNKSDLMPYDNKELLDDITSKSKVISISALSSEGIENLKGLIVEDFAKFSSFKGSYSVTSRQLSGITATIFSLVETKNALTSGIGDDIALTCIADARSSLAQVIGIDPTEDLVERIFGDFCVGK
ncbi:MAG: GTP-binding protein, partial [Synergistaceae bacterium]|nr:GTP-binding protein [Synergistaceae bacterium]